MAKNGLIPVLTPIQLRFVEARVQGLKIPEIAKLIGAAETTCRFWAKHPEIASEVQRRLRHAYEASQVTPDRIIAELAKVGFANQADIVSFDENGQPLYDFSEVTRDQMAAIEAIEVEEFVVGRGDAARDVRKVRVKHHSKTVALQTLARIQRMLVDRQEHAGPGGGPIPVAHAHHHVVDVRSLSDDDRDALEGVLSRIGNGEANDGYDADAEREAGEDDADNDEGNI